jgi:hypothetical protein
VVTERALQFQGLGGEDASGFKGAGVIVPQGVKASGGLVSIMWTDTVFGEYAAKK